VQGDDKKNEQKGPVVICRPETVNLWTVNFLGSKGFAPFAGPWLVRLQENGITQTASGREIHGPVRDLRSLWEVSSVSSPPLAFTSHISAPSFVRAVVNSCSGFQRASSNSSCPPHGRPPRPSSSVARARTHGVPLRLQHGLRSHSEVASPAAPHGT
jgi:hypothetical protein